MELVRDFASLDIELSRFTLAYIHRAESDLPAAEGHDIGFPMGKPVEGLVYKKKGGETQFMRLDDRQATPTALISALINQMSILKEPHKVRRDRYLDLLRWHLAFRYWVVDLKEGIEFPDNCKKNLKNIKITF